MKVARIARPNMASGDTCLECSDKMIAQGHRPLLLATVGCATTVGLCDSHTRELVNALEAALARTQPNLYPCGCSKHKVNNGMCCTYKPGELP